MKEKLNNKFRDGFLGNSFLWVPNKNTNIYYLHGGLHLYITPDNKVAKYRFFKGNSLKAQIVTALKENEFPISVSGGTS